MECFGLQLNKISVGYIRDTNVHNTLIIMEFKFHFSFLLTENCTQCKISDTASLPIYDYRRIYLKIHIDVYNKHALTEIVAALCCRDC